MTRAAVLLEVREVPAAPPACTARHRERFHRCTLPPLLEEFGDQLLVRYQALPNEEDSFLPLITVHDEPLAAGGFPCARVLRLTIARHIAMEYFVDELAAEAGEEAAARGIEAGCWQDALLYLANSSGEGK